MSESVVPSLSRAAARAPDSPVIPGLTWRGALSADRGWALIIDGHGRNIAEVHRPALSVGPVGRPFTFVQAVRLMSAAPQLMALLENLASDCGAGASVVPADLRDRARALLATCR